MKKLTRKKATQKKTTYQYQKPSHLRFDQKYFLLAQGKQMV
jgi:hypothetical protein